MKKVFLIHGFEGSPNGGWRPWLMAELEKTDIYACALSMPDSENPLCAKWVEEIHRHIVANPNDDIYLVGHSLGAPAILRYLESSSAIAVKGVILASGPSEKNNNRKIDSFLETPFDFPSIQPKAQNFCIIHGDNDPFVPLDNAQFLSEQLNCPLIVIPNGGHLSGSNGCFRLPEALEALQKMF